MLNSTDILSEAAGLLNDSLLGVRRMWEKTSYLLAYIAFWGKLLTKLSVGAKKYLFSSPVISLLKLKS